MGAWPTVLGCAALALFGNARAADYPFVGKWDCEVGVFTFTNRTYHNGTATLTFDKIEFDKMGYKLTFPDGYAISLLEVKRSSMYWHSLASGDTFRCRRLK